MHLKWIAAFESTQLAYFTAAIQNQLVLHPSNLTEQKTTAQANISEKQLPSCQM